ncbi:MAG: hypothetical protein CM15mP103_09020 [Gammaproteobacteria bacterium]|nr:MAG: hypothetical protein CM15mP103_09020 [Gammaproteobacteria bacterium]
MVRWPSKIPARKSNEMVAIHDFLPTFAAMLGGDLPADRPIDGRNQLDFSPVKPNSQRGKTTSPSRWRGERGSLASLADLPEANYVLGGQPSALGVYGYRVEGMGYPAVYNIARDPREQMNQVGTEAWVIASYMKIIGAYQASSRSTPTRPGLA